MKNNLKIRWIGQGGYLLWDEKTTICIDPYLSDVVNRLAGRARMVEAPFSPEDLFADAVICTHNHVDHVDIDAIPLIKKENKIFLAPTDAKEQLEACGVTQYMAFDEGDSYSFGDFRLTAVFADHSVPAIGVVVEHRGVKLYFSGDTEYHPRLEKLKALNIDVMFVCINGRLGNMNVDEAVRLTGIIDPKVGVPTHDGMFESNTEDPKKYTNAVKCGFEMKHNVSYSVGEVLADV